MSLTHAAVDTTRSVADAPFFLLGRNSAGHWVIRETSGRRGGLFRTRAAAIKYAREESIDGNFTIIEAIDGLEFDGAPMKPKNSARPIEIASTVPAL